MGFDNTLHTKPLPPCSSVFYIEDYRYIHNRCPENIIILHDLADFLSTLIERA